MGGIDGLMGHVSRIQKFIQGIQQMSPMLKVLMGSFGSKAITKANEASPKRRRRRTSTRKSSRKTYNRRSR
jgi:hypothetical protein